MPKKISDGFRWEKKEVDFLKKDAKRGFTMRAATDRLNRKFHRYKRVGRSVAGVMNKIRDVGIQFHGVIRGHKITFVPTKKLIADVKKRFLRGESKESIIITYSADRKIPVVQFKQWIYKLKGRTNNMPKDKIRSVKDLEAMFTDQLNGLTGKQIAAKWSLTIATSESILRNWKSKRKNMMTKILLNEPSYDIMLEFDITIQELGEFRRLARVYDPSDIDEELSVEPVWTKEQRVKARNAIKINVKNMRDFITEVRFFKKEIRTELKYICLLCSGDWHYESIYTDQEQLELDVGRVKNTPGVYAVFVGDATDNGYASPHKDLLLDSGGSAKMSRAAVLDLFLEMKNKLLLMTDGCHVLWTKKAVDYNPYEEFAKQMNVPYLGPGGTMELKLNDISYRGHARHLFRGGRTNLLNAPMKYIKEEDPSCDFAIVGHNHVNSIGTEDWAQKQRVYVRSGSYKDVDTYAKQFGFSSQETRTPPCIIFNTQKKSMRIERSLEEGIETMEGLNRGSKE